MDSTLVKHLKGQVDTIFETLKKLPPEEQKEINEFIKKSQKDLDAFIKEKQERTTEQEQEKDLKKFVENYHNKTLNELSPENIKQLELIYNIKITVHRDKNVPGLTAIKSFENADFKNCGCFTRALEMVKEYCDANSSQGKPTYIHKNTKGTFYAFCPEKGSRAGTKSKLSEGLSSQIDSKGYISIQIEWL